MMEINASYQFISAFHNVSGDVKQYLVQNQEFESASSKQKKIRTNEIVNFSDQALKAIRNHSHIDLKARIKILQKLDHALENYAERISNWNKGHWWFCILKCFGYKQCPAKLTAVQKAVRSAIKDLSSPQKTEPLPDNKVSHIQIKPTVNTTFTEVWSKLKGYKDDMSGKVLEFLSPNDLAALQQTAKTEKILVSSHLEKRAKLMLTEDEFKFGKEQGAQCLKDLMEKAAKPLTPQKEEPALSQVDLAKKCLSEKYGFTVEEIESVPQAQFELKKLLRQAEEAYDTIVLCCCIPQAERVLLTCSEEVLKDKLTPDLRKSLVDFATNPRIEFPKLQGQTLLDLADKIKKYFNSEEAQKIGALEKAGYALMEAVPLSINSLKGLRKLKLHGFFETIPTLALPNLELLQIDAAIEKVPYLNTPNLKMLGIQTDNSLRVPNFRGNLEKLTELNIGSSSFGGERYICQWPENTELPLNLKILRIQGSSKVKIPNSIGKLTQLEEFVLFQKVSRGYRVMDPIIDSIVEDRSIPPDFALLKNLRRLYIHHAWNDRYDNTQEIQGLDILFKLNLREAELTGLNLRKYIYEKNIKMPEDADFIITF